MQGKPLGDRHLNLPPCAVSSVWPEQPALTRRQCCKIGYVEKKCGKCGTVRPLTEFAKNRTKADGLQAMCRTCKRSYNAEYYTRTKSRHNPQRALLRTEAVRSARERLAEYLRSHPCIDCGETDIVVLQFDHLRDKVMNIHAMVRSGLAWRRIAQEIAKCEVVCANDHHRRTARAQGWSKALPLAEPQGAVS